jgi:hypothetical protein
MSRSLTLRFCEAVRSAANALSWVHRSCAMMTPMPWSMTAREVSEVRSWSIRPV